MNMYPYEIVGHISGKNLSSIKFIADSIKSNGELQKIMMGEMYIVMDKMNKDRFLLRVSDIGYGQSEQYMKESARAHNRLVSPETYANVHNDAYEIYQEEVIEQLFLEAECELVGYINDTGKFGPPKHLPSYDSPVRKLNANDLDFMKDFLGDIPFGKMRSGNDVLPIDVGLSSKWLPYHTGVFAKTGKGKSNFVQRIVGGVLETGRVGMLLLEPHGEYKQNLEIHPYASDNMIVFSAKEGESKRQIKISYQDLTVADVMNVKKQLNFSEPQERFMREVEEIVGNDWFRYIIETPATKDDLTPDMAMLFGETGILIKEQFRNTGEDTIRVTQSKLKRIKAATYLKKDKNVSDVTEILTLLDKGKVVLLDIASIDYMEALLISSVMSSRVLKHRKRIYETNKQLLSQLPPIVILLEEAQRILNKESNTDSNVFAQICNEGRKFLVGLFIITQQPKNIDNSLLSQINTLFILGITDKRDFEALRDVSSNPIDKLELEIKGLEPGEAILTSPSSPFAVPVKVDLYENYIKEAKDKKNIFKPKKASFQGMV